MDSIGVVDLGAESSRPVSPKTIPHTEETIAGDRLAATHSNGPGSGKKKDQRGEANCTNACRPRQSLRLRTSVPTAKTRAGSQRQVASPAGNYMPEAHCLDPRPLEELLNERSYLLYNLQKQGDRAKRLYQKYADLEARLSAPQTSSEGKRCKREAASIKSKIAESVQQEQLMMLRLGEIHVELQNRGRWMEVHQLTSPQPTPTIEYMEYPLFMGSGGPAVSPYSDSPPTTARSRTFPCSSVLSPLSPPFTPSGGVVFFEDIWSRASGTSTSKEAETESPQPDSADWAEETGQSGQEPVMVRRQAIPEEKLAIDEVAESAFEATDDEPECEDAHTWRARLRRMSLSVPLPFKAQDRRMSMPYVKDLWPRSQRNSL